jgi:hypothetical protein
LTSSSYSNHNGNADQEFSGKVEAAVAQLHLAELKAILLQKRSQLSKSPLAKQITKAEDADLLEAKARMRALIGRWTVFLELEMQQPLLLRIGLVFR